MNGIQEFPLDVLFFFFWGGGRGGRGRRGSFGEVTLTDDYAT